MKMARELYDLWDNEGLFVFLEGEEYVAKKEKEITQCLTEKKRKEFILLAKVDYLLERQ
jgi:hypothetical protein